MLLLMCFLLPLFSFPFSTKPLHVGLGIGVGFSLASVSEHVLAKWRRVPLFFNSFPFTVCRIISMHGVLFCFVFPFPLFSFKFLKATRDTGKISVSLLLEMMSPLKSKQITCNQIYYASSTMQLAYKKM